MESQNINQKLLNDSGTVEALSLRVTLMIFALLDNAEKYHLKLEEETYKKIKKGRKSYENKNPFK